MPPQTGADNDTPARPPLAAESEAVLARVPAEHEDLAVGLLWEAGTQGIEVRLAEADAEAEAGGAVVLVAYFAPSPTLLDDLRQALAPARPLAIEPLRVPAVDWVARFRETFRGFEAAGFRIVPAWEASAEVSSGRGRDDDGDNPAGAGAGVIVVDPGRAFGTGTHETTRLCLALLGEEARRRPLRDVADVGCGTGILAVAAHKLGAARVVALDYDPEAVLSARLHARLNAAPLHLVQADGGRALAPGRFDLVLANLMAALLVERRDELAALAAPGGVLVLSGLLDGDLPTVRAAYAACGRVSERHDGEWAALRIERP